MNREFAGPLHSTLPGISINPAPLAMGTTNFRLVFCTRSDGLRSVQLGKNRREENCPKPEQLSKEPKEDKNGKEVLDYYRELYNTDGKYRDWCMKLGGMIVRNFGAPEDQQFAHCTILAYLPEGYRIYEHIKTRPTSAEKNSKAHAGGGHDRQDAYLYGHPGGRRQRFRSPAEFFPHLVWLARGSDFDHDNCKCKLCSPDELQSAKPKRRTLKAEVAGQSATPQPAAPQGTDQQAAATQVGSEPRQTLSVEATYVSDRDLSSASAAMTPQSAQLAESVNASAYPDPSNVPAYEYQNHMQTQQFSAPSYESHQSGAFYGMQRTASEWEPAPMQYSHEEMGGQQQMPHQAQYPQQWQEQLGTQADQEFLDFENRGMGQHENWGI